MHLSHELNTKLRFFFFAFIAVALGVSMSVLQYRKTFQNQAQENKDPLLVKQPETPLYKDGEVIVKLKQPLDSSVLGVSISKSDTSSKAIPPEESPNILNLPSSLQEVGKKYRIKDAEEIVDEAPRPSARRTGDSMSTMSLQQTETQSDDLKNLYKITFDESAPVQEIAAELSKNPQVEYAEPNYVITIGKVPNDPYYSTTNSWGQQRRDLWGMDAIAADTAWDSTTGSAAVVVADIDTGVDRNHPDLAANMWVNTNEINSNGIDDDVNGFIDDYYGWDFANNDNNPMDDNGHGTHTAGTIAAVGNNGVGIPGVAWTTQIMPLKFLTITGSGYTDNAIKAIKYAADMGSRVSSNSWGSAGHSQSLNDALIYAHNRGVITVVAAGNDNLDAMGFFPARYNEAITVGAMSPYFLKAYFSNWGQRIDVVAPGEDILSTKSAVGSVCSANFPPNPQYCRLSGTSMATPHVSGLVALLLSKNPSLTNEQIRQILRTTSKDLGSAGPDSNFGYGLIQASSALDKGSSGNYLGPFISYPRNAQSIAGTAIEIRGSVTGNNFSSYIIEASAINDANNWTKIAESTQQVTNGVLTVFDTTSLKDATYTIRITAIDTFGNKYSYSIFNINLKNYVANIDDPYSLINSKTQVIKGSAYLLNPAIFQSYKLEWREKGSNGLWSTEGITLPSGGLAPVGNNALGTWDLSNRVSNKDYSLKLTVTSKTGSFIDTTTDYLYYLIRPKTGWPKTIGSETSYSIPTVEDLDGDGNKEVLAPDFNSLHVFNNTGTYLPGWPLKLTAYIGMPSVGNIDDSPQKEIVVLDGYAKLFVFSSQGVALPGFPKNPDEQNAGSSYPPVLADLDGDGKDEIIVNQGLKLIHAYKAGGTEPAGWPITYDSSYPSYYEAILAAGDLDGDKNIEVVVNGRSHMSVYSKNGTKLPGWPVTFPSVTFDRKPVIADLNNDGKSEIIVLARYQVSSGSSTYLYIFNPDGSILKRVDTGLSNFSYGTDIAVADLQNDGYKEIIVPTALMIWVIDHQGNFFEYQQGFPINGTFDDRFYSSPIVLDVDNDGLKEIFIKSEQEITSRFKFMGLLYGYKRDGTKLPGFPFMTHLSGNPTIDDIDKDGKLEIIYISGNSLYVVPVANSQKSNLQPDWNHTYHDSKHSANFDNLPAATPTLTPTPSSTLTPTPTRTPTPTKQKVQIRGYVWKDTNNNTTYEAGEEFSTTTSFTAVLTQADGTTQTLTFAAQTVYNFMTTVYGPSKITVAVPAGYLVAKAGASNKFTQATVNGQQVAVASFNVADPGSGPVGLVETPLAFTPIVNTPTPTSTLTPLPTKTPTPTLSPTRIPTQTPTPTPPPNKSAPVIGAIAIPNPVVRYRVYSIPFIVTDPDKDSVTVRVTGLPRVFSYYCRRPSRKQDYVANCNILGAGLVTGTYPVEIRATDSRSNVSIRKVTFTVR